MRNFIFSVFFAETSKTIPILIIHNLVCQFQFSSVCVCVVCFISVSLAAPFNNPLPRVMMNCARRTRNERNYTSSIYFICTLRQNLHKILWCSSYRATDEKSSTTNDNAALIASRHYIAVYGVRAHSWSWSVCNKMHNIKLNYHIFTAEINYECNFSLTHTHPHTHTARAKASRVVMEYAMTKWKLDDKVHGKCFTTSRDNIIISFCNATSIFRSSDRKEMEMRVIAPCAIVFDHQNSTK